MRSLCVRVVFIFLLTGCYFILTPSVKAATETTLYLGSVEKNLESGETKVYYQAGTLSVVRTIKPNNISTVSYLHSDHLGSTILITSDKGNVEGSTLVYYPYGQSTINNSIRQAQDKQQLTTDNLYTGQKRDTSSDLYFYNARYYNPTIAHFVSADKAEGGNRYAYVANNPIMRNDPTGRQDESEKMQLQNLEIISDVFKRSLPEDIYPRWYQMISVPFVMTIPGYAYVFTSLGPYQQKLLAGKSELESSAMLNLEQKITKDIRIVNKMFNLYESKSDLGYVEAVNWAVNKNVPYNELGAQGKDWFSSSSYRDNNTLSKRIESKTSVCFDMAAIEQIYLGKRNIMADFSRVFIKKYNQSHAFLTIKTKSGKEYIADPLNNLFVTKEEYNEIVGEQLKYNKAWGIFRIEEKIPDIGYFGI